MKQPQIKSTQKLIYESVIAIISEGKADFTVSEIAERANVGKGTVYEYCKSKEELVSDAILYYADNVISSVLKLELKGSFKERILFYISTAQSLVRSNVTLFRFLMTHSEVAFSTSYAERFTHLFAEIKKCIIEIVIESIKVGVEEGVFDKMPSYEMIYYAYTTTTFMIKSILESHGLNSDTLKRNPLRSIRKASEIRKTKSLRLQKAKALILRFLT